MSSVRGAKYAHKYVQCCKCIAHQARGRTEKNNMTYDKSNQNRRSDIKEEVCHPERHLVKGLALTNYNNKLIVVYVAVIDK